MTAVGSSISMLRQQYLNGEADPLETLETALARSNRNAGHNVYLGQDPEWTRNAARTLSREDLVSQPLWGIPVSLKDCFELQGFATSCGSRFYREHLGTATADSAVARKLRAAGAIITGKTHMHQLAYGITGENRDFGDCVQPLDAACLTGGSSSGAAASVQEGSAMAAIGTDTGGSVRAPTALCGIAGYRSSIMLNPPAIWEGGYHLAASFDTVGWLYKDLRDGPLLGRALLDLPLATATVVAGLRVGVPDERFLWDCDDEVQRSFRVWRDGIEALGAKVDAFDAAMWGDSMAIYAPLQASEAAALHRGYFDHFEPAIAERLAWGASLSPDELSRLRQRMVEFRRDTYALSDRFDYLLLPCAPMTSLAAGEDQAETRGRILRYTTPMSVAGLPVVTLPTLRDGRPSGGMQLVGPMGGDAELLALSAALSEKCANNARLHP